VLTIWGISCTQVVQLVAQKFTSTTLPRRADNLLAAVEQGHLHLGSGFAAGAAGQDERRRGGGGQEAGDETEVLTATHTLPERILQKMPQCTSGA
jgi:hypothetical protein